MEQPLDLSKLVVRVQYRNAAREIIGEEEFPLINYMKIQENRAMHLVTDVENLLYDIFDGKPKEEWPDHAYREFLLLRHKILDHAGNVGRVPEMLYKVE
jgi:hypothetical protein